MEALVRNYTSAVVMIDEHWTGCGACAEACPYGMIEVVDDTAVKCDLWGKNPNV
jgi:Fe-S-cluster-containing hydrogenase component 2